MEAPRVHVRGPRLHAGGALTFRLASPPALTSEAPGFMPGELHLPPTSGRLLVIISLHGLPEVTLDLGSRRGSDGAHIEPRLPDTRQFQLTQRSSVTPLQEVLAIVHQAQGYVFRCVGRENTRKQVRVIPYHLNVP